MPVPPRAAAVQPESLLGTEEIPAAALKVRPNQPFLYVFYPDDPGNWFVGPVAGEPTWLPRLQKLALIPGVNGVRTLRKGEAAEMAYVDAVDKVRRKGGVVLDRTLDYCFRTPAQDPQTGVLGYVYHDQFETPRIPKGRNKRVVKYDDDPVRRAAWLAWLVTEGVVPPPHQDIVSHNEARLLGRVYERADRRSVQLPEDLGTVDSKKVPKMVAEAIREAEAVTEARVLEPKQTPVYPSAVAEKKPRGRRLKSEKAPPEEAPDDA